ncbi:hypothetical protein ABTK42_19985, partial [Acinetobacter baumannii]
STKTPLVPSDVEARELGEALAARPSTSHGTNGGVQTNPLDVRADFPGIADWHYLDTAATAQKPQAVIDAIARAYGPDYATV